MRARRSRCVAVPLAFALVLPLCAFAAAKDAQSRDAALRAKLDVVVVIYAENRSFDNLFGRFPGADGLDAVMTKSGKPNAHYVPQVDRDGTVLATLPPTWNGVTAFGVTPVVTQAQSTGLPNAPFPIETAFKPMSGVVLSGNTITRDLYHRFFENQMEIDGGKNDGFAAWSDAGGLVMGHFDYSKSALYRLARKFTLADHFFQGAFGGSFLNHQYLICACAPEYPHADNPPTGAKPTFAVLDKDAQGNDLPRLTTTPTSPRSALEGPARFVVTGNIAPATYFGDGKFYAINTMQPPYQPSGVPPVDDAGEHRAYADPASAVTLPPLSAPNIGDQLTHAGVAWRWYAGGWQAGLADGMQAPNVKRSVIYSSAGPGLPVNFQPHHAPFNYYARFDPVAHPDERAEHLKDLSDLDADIAAGRLPPVVFYKPEGDVNQHPGYANLDAGDAHIADLVAKLEKSPQWKKMVIVITYDEFGGIWDHAPPPKGDKLGPGTRIPAIVISPFAKRHYVDHTAYDTASILRLIARRWDLPKLPGVAARDAALAAHGEPPLGDLTNALDL